jgi:hypothetical protein
LFAVLDFNGLSQISCVEGPFPVGFGPKGV